MKNKLCVSWLEPSFIIKGFNSDPKNNYEYYLTELLNNSDWIAKEFRELFVWNPSQSNGECDAYSGEYGIDYKLTASNTLLQALSLFKDRIISPIDGVLLNIGSKDTGSIKTTKLYVALRGLNQFDLEMRFNNPHINKQGEEKDVYLFLKSLSRNKNLLLFFPYRFSFDDQIKPNDGYEIIVEALQDSFGQSFVFRSNHVQECDTFFITLYYNDFMLMKVLNNQLHLVDIVPTTKCPTFSYIKGKFIGKF